MPAKKFCCKNCFFLYKIIDHNDTKRGVRVQNETWNQEERNNLYPIPKKDPSPTASASIRTIQCHEEYWIHPADDVQFEEKLQKKKLKRTISKNRRNKCQYVEYTEGASMNTAQRKAEAQRANRSIIKSNIALYISGCALGIAILSGVVNALITLGLID